MKTQTKSNKQNTAPSHKNQSPDPAAKKAAEKTGENISTNSSKDEDPDKPKRLGESQTEITDETTI